jgi:SAM-dependent methyltransferase
MVLHRDGKHFNREWYLKQYPDVMLAGKDPLIHFVWKGIYEDRQPNEQFNCTFYLTNNNDIASYSKSPLIHFMLHGYREDRLWLKKTAQNASDLAFSEREKFFSMVNQRKSILEIGKLGNPIFQESKNVDVFTRDELVFLYRKDPNVDPKKITQVDYVVKNNDWSVIEEKFDYLVTSHNIEHTPCLISFFRNASHVLKDGGKIFAALPDYRYCFDVDKLPSTILDVIEAKYLKREKPGIRDVLETMLLRSSVFDPAILWQKGEYQLTASKYFEIEPSRLKKVLGKDFSKYFDAHCWKFTPDSFRYIVNTLHEIEEIDFKLVNIYHTQPDSVEFFVILEKVNVPHPYYLFSS